MSQRQSEVMRIRMSEESMEQRRERMKRAEQGYQRWRADPIEQIRWAYLQARSRQTPYRVVLVLLLSLSIWSCSPPPGFDDALIAAATAIPTAAMDIPLPGITMRIVAHVQADDSLCRQATKCELARIVGADGQRILVVTPQNLALLARTARLAETSGPPDP